MRYLALSMLRARTSLAVCLLVVAALPVDAHGRAVTEAPAEPEPAQRRTLRSSLGVAKARARLVAADRRERRLGIERLATLGTAESLDVLLEALRTGDTLREPELRLYAVRVLAPHAGRSEVRSWLLREASAADARSPGRSRELDALVRETAALALAREGSDASTAALASLAASRGAASASALSALVLARPERLDAILYLPEDPSAEAASEPGEAELVDDDDEEERGVVSAGGSASTSGGEGAAGAQGEAAPGSSAPTKAGAEGVAPERSPRSLTPSLLRLLGELGDLRALPVLVGELERGDRPGRAAAALALARLGDHRGVAAVSPWLDGKDGRALDDAVAVLHTLGRLSEAERGVLAMLELPQVRVPALRRARAAPTPAIAKRVEALLPELEGEPRALAVSVLARAGAVGPLSALLSDASVSAVAMSGLAECPGERARLLITELADASSPELRRAGLRVAVLRALTLGERIDGLSERLERLLASKDASDREAAGFGLVAIGALELDELVEREGEPDVALLSGAARAALRSPASLAALGRYFGPASPRVPGALELAAGPALGVPEVADRVPLATLLSWAESGGPLAALAARAAPRRDDGTYASRLAALLASPDPTMRVAVSAGLAESREPSITGLLAEAYAAEPDARVRRAFVRALSARREHAREATLAWAARLDPDASVRALAVRGRGGGAASSPSYAELLGLERARATLVQVASAGPRSLAHPLRLVAPSGFALPASPAPDGALLVLGWPYGRGSLELAPALGSAQVSTP